MPRLPGASFPALSTPTVRGAENSNPEGLPGIASRLAMQTGSQRSAWKVGFVQPVAPSALKATSLRLGAAVVREMSMTRPSASSATLDSFGPPMSGWFGMATAPACQVMPASSL